MEIITFKTIFIFHVINVFIIFKKFFKLFTSVEIMTAQRGWHDICRRFTSIIYNDICNANIISDIYPIFRSRNIRTPVELGENQLRDNQLGDTCWSTGRQCPQLFTPFVHVLILVNLC